MDVLQVSTLPSAEVPPSWDDQGGGADVGNNLAAKYKYSIIMIIDQGGGAGG